MCSCCSKAVYQSCLLRLSVVATEFFFVSCFSGHVIYWLCIERWCPLSLVGRVRSSNLLLYC